MDPLVIDREYEYLLLLTILSMYLAGVRVGSIDGKFIANPSREQMQRSDLNLVVSVNQKGHLGNLLFSRHYVSLSILVFVQ